MDQHQLICALKDLALELGRTPTRDEFASKVKNAHFLIVKIFGNYSIMVQAAGLDPVSRKRKFTNEIFERSVVEVIQERGFTKRLDKIKYDPTLIIGDLHFPFVHKPTIEKIIRFAGREKPLRIIQLGDLYDQYAHTRFPKSQNIYSPKDEEQVARRMAEEMWRELKLASPEAECVQTKGNHDLRMLRQTLSVLPSVEHIISKYLDELMTFPGVTLVKDEREEYIFDDVCVIHGYRSKLGDHRDYNLMNTIRGHDHVGGVVFRSIKGNTLWELDAGFVADAESKALGYTAQKLSKQTLGWGFVDEYGPRFIPA